MSNELTAHYILINDIDASATEEWNSGEGFSPIGTKENENWFDGSLGGRNHTISELKINLPDTNYVGLFGYVGSEGSVKNLGLVEANISGGNIVGGIAGYNDNLVSNCHFSGSVSGPGCIGGLVGINDKWISDCSSIGNVNGTGNVGGLVGINDYFITRCCSKTEVTGTKQAGGLIGTNRASIENCYATGGVSGNSSVGGLVGYNYGSPYEGSARCCYSTGHVKGNESVGGLVGFNTGSVSRCFWNLETSDQNTSSGGEGKSTSEMKMRSTYNWNFYNAWCMIDEVTYPLLAWQDEDPPIAHAGEDMIINQGTRMTLSGNLSMDNFGIKQYKWTFLCGESVGLTGNCPRYQFDQPGTFNVTLNVTDVGGNWDTDTVLITVLDIFPPLANAGPDLIVDEKTIVFFNGTSSEDNVGIVNYTWTILYESKIISLYDVSPQFNFSIPGNYSVTLNVSDDAGNWNIDIMNLSVNDMTPPLANGGEDITVPAGETVILNGSLSSDNGMIKNHTWTMKYDDEEIRIYGDEFSHTFEKGGIFYVILSVRDQYDNYDDDTIVVTVIDTGKVSGMIQDQNGEAVEGANVEIIGSDDQVYTSISGSDGTFSVEVQHGPFRWTISKEGYENISGNSSVDAMGEEQLDLSESILVKIEESESRLWLFIIPPVVLVIIIITAIVIFILMKRRSEDMGSYATQSDEHDDVVDPKSEVTHLDDTTIEKESSPEREYEQ